MRALVVYESMYGNTHLVAEAIGEGLAGIGHVEVVPLSEADPERVRAADLVVVGGPTHAHGMTRESTRRAAVEAAQQPDSDLALDPGAGAEGPGLREWLDASDGAGTKAAAFDTRIHIAAALSGRASKGIGRALHRHGFEEIAEPASFFVTKESTLEPGETDRARQWGRQLAASLGAVAAR